MKSERKPTYEELGQRAEAAEKALQDLRDGLVQTIEGAHGTLVVRLAEHESRASHIKNILLAIRNVNQLIISEDDPLRLIISACKNLTGTMGYLSAWIALLDPEGTRAWLTASSGFAGDFDALDAHLKAGKFPDCMKRALLSQGIVLVKQPRAECPECPLSLDYRDRAGLSRRLDYNGRTYGVLSVSVPADYAPDQEEQSLFEEVAGDLAFALYKIEMARLLEDNRRRYLEIFQGSRDGFVMVDPSGRITDANQAFCDMLGYTLEELRALPDFYRITPERWHEWERSEIWENRLLNQGHSGLYEKEYIRKDGTIIPIELRCYAVFSSAGELDYLWGTAREITERKRAEQSLLARERYLNTILQTTADGFLEIDSGAKIIESNGAYCKMSGYSREELLGKTIRDIEAQETSAETAARIERVLRQGSELFETRHRKKDGEILPVEVSTTFLDERGGRFVCFIRDLTARKQREARIALLGQMLDAAPAGIAIHDTNGRFLFANEITASLHGYASVEEFLAVPLDRLDVTESQALIQARMRKIEEEGQARFEVAHFRKDGTSFPLEILAKTIEWEGRPAILSIMTDITARVLAEGELRRSEALLQEIFEVLPIGLWFADAEGTLQRGNPMGVKIWGAEPKVPLSEYGVFKGWRLPSREPIAPEEWALARTIREGVTIVDELIEIEAFDGQRKTILNYTTPVKDGSGNVAGAIVMNLDISDRKALEEKLRQAQKMESIGRLAGGVAHDFNNMLSVILGYAELAMGKTPPDSPIADHLKQIHGAAKRSADITLQLLAFARKQTIAPKLLDLNQTVEGMLKMLRRLIGEEIDLSWQPHSPIWPVKMDPSQIDQILANLCLNARDAIASTGKLTIETATTSLDQAYCARHPGFRPGDFVVLAVSDDGCGMDKQTLENLFEPFFTTKEVHRGTGLGLSTVYGIVKQNQGFINVYSEPGQGTTFRLYIPAYREIAITDAPKTVPIVDRPQRGETILLVEDEPEILKMTSIMLEGLGYTVLPAGTPNEALLKAREHPGQIHLLMTDVVLPEMNGRELAKNVHTLYPNIKRLFMSGYTANVIAHHGVLDQGVHFIQKPFSRHDLAAKLRDALES